MSLRATPERNSLNCLRVLSLQAGKVDLLKTISKSKSSPGCGVVIVSSVTSLLRKITNIEHVVWDRPRLRRTSELLYHFGFRTVEALSVETRELGGGEAFTNKHTCIFGLLCMRLRPRVEMGAIHNA